MILPNVNGLTIENMQPLLFWQMISSVTPLNRRKGTPEYKLGRTQIIQHDLLLYFNKYRQQIEEQCQLLGH